MNCDPVRVGPVRYAGSPGAVIRIIAPTFLNLILWNFEAFGLTGDFSTAKSVLPDA